MSDAPEMLPEQDVPSLRLADAWSDQYDLGIATFLLDAGSRAAEAMMRVLSRSTETITTHALVENESHAGVGYERFLTRVLESSELRATVRAVYAYFNPRDGDAFTLDVDVDDRDGNASTPRASLRAASNGIGPVLRVACESKAPIFSSRSLAKVAVRAFDAPDDPIDRAAHDAAHDALDTMSLWYGHLALMVRNFATAQSTIVSAVATTEEVWPPRSPRFEQTRRWMRALQRPGDDLRSYAVAMVEAGLNEGASRETTFEEIDAERAQAKLQAALTSSWNGRSEDEVRALMEVFARAPHRYFSLGDRRYQSVASVSLFVVSHDRDRVALVEYVGDGP